MPDMTVDERMAALLDAELDHRERANMATESHPRPPRRDPNEPWTAEQILHKLERSDKFLERSLTVLYARQTAEEQTSGDTRETNGVGFNKFDAPFLTSLAAQIARNAADPRSRYHLEGHRLSPAQRSAARRAITKYVRQLVDHANRNLNATS